MPTRIPQRELRNHTAEVLRRVEEGERVEITVNGRPVAELGPIDTRREFVPSDELRRKLAGVLPADDPLAEELKAADTPARDPFA
jgi:prevent-host-death family protein